MGDEHSIPIGRVEQVSLSRPRCPIDAVATLGIVPAAKFDRAQSQHIDIDAGAEIDLDAAIVDQSAAAGNAAIRFVDTAGEQQGFGRCNAQVDLSEVGCGMTFEDIPAASDIDIESRTTTTWAGESDDVAGADINGAAARLPLPPGLHGDDVAGVEVESIVCSQSQRLNGVIKAGGGHLLYALHGF